MSDLKEKEFDFNFFTQVSSFDDEDDECEDEVIEDGEELEDEFYYPLMSFESLEITRNMDELEEEEAKERE